MQVFVNVFRVFNNLSQKWNKAPGEILNSIDDAIDEAATYILEGDKYSFTLTNIGEKIDLSDSIAKQIQEWKEEKEKL